MYLLNTCLLPDAGISENTWPDLGEGEIPGRSHHLARRQEDHPAGWGRLTCTHLYTHVLLCTPMYSCVLTCTYIYSHVLLCTHMNTPVSFAHLHSPVHSCTQLITLVLTCACFYLCTPLLTFTYLFKQAAGLFHICNMWMYTILDLKTWIKDNIFIGKQNQLSFKINYTNCSSKSIKKC